MKPLLKAMKFTFFLALIFLSCKSETKKTTPEPKDNTIEITTRGMEFQMQDTIIAGWNTFRYKNLSNETHFVVFEKYPEGKNVNDTKTEILPVFDKGMTLINEGKSAEGFEAFSNLPPWFFQVVFEGGVGLTSPKTTSESTIHLDPGNYLIECYVKMPNGKFHSVMGMYKEIHVIAGTNTNTIPKPSINLSISSDNGIEINSPITAGNQIVGVTFKDQKVHEHFLGHDVHLVRLNNLANLEKLDSWMSWVNPKGLITPAPKGVTFLGGMQEMPQGSIGYFNADLTPGNYAFVAEVPEPTKKKMLKQFTVK